MSPRKRVFVFPVIVSSAAMLSGWLLAYGAPKAASKADLTLKDLNGEHVRLRDYRGKNVVLNFWATWCGPCNAELPMLVEAEKEYRARGIVFIGASLDDEKTRRLVPEFLNVHSVSYPVWVGATADDLDKLGMGAAVPATAFIDRDGYIVLRILGQMRPEELKQRLEWLAGNQAGSKPEPLVKHLEGK